MLPDLFYHLDLYLSITEAVNISCSLSVRSWILSGCLPGLISFTPFVRFSWCWFYLYILGYAHHEERASLSCPLSPPQHLNRCAARVSHPVYVSLVGDFLPCFESFCKHIPQ